MAFSNLSGVINVSDLPAELNTRLDEIRRLERSANASAPSVKPTGLWWNRTDEASLGDAIMRWNGSAWTVLMDPEAAQLNAAGTVALAADLPAGGFKLTGLGAGTANGHSVRYEQVVLRSGALALTGNLDCGGQRLTNLGAPTADTDALRRMDAGSVFKTNRDASLPLKIQLASDPSGTFCELGFVPRRVTLLMAGQIRTQSGNNAVGSPVDTTLSPVVFARYDGDATGGYTPPTSLNVATGQGTTQYVVEWKFTNPQGFFLRIAASTGTLATPHAWLRNPSNSAVDAAIQAIIER